MHTRYVRIFLVFALACVQITAVVAQQAGFELVVSSSSGLRWIPVDSDYSFTQRFRASFGANTLLGDQGRIRVLAFAEYTPGPDAFLDGEYLIDLEQLYVEVQSPDVFGGLAVYRLGRYSFRDRTGRIAVHPADGLRIRGDFGSSIFRMDAGYTGLVLLPSSRILLTSEDALLQASTADDAVFGPGRLLTRSGYGRRNERGSEWGVELFTQWDLPNVMPPADLNAGPSYHSAFLTVYSETPISDLLVLNASAIVGTGAAFPEPILSEIEFSILAEAFLEYYPGADTRNILTFAWIAASSEATGLSDYRPVTPLTLGRVEPVPAAGHTQFSASWATRPFIAGALSGLQIVLDSRGIFRLGRTQISELVNDDTESVYLGLDSGLSLRYRPVSDLSLLASVFAYLPGSGLTVSSPVLSGRLQFALSF